MPPFSVALSRVIAIPFVTVSTSIAINNDVGRNLVLRRDQSAKPSENYVMVLALLHTRLLAPQSPSLIMEGPIAGAGRRETALSLALRSDNVMLAMSLYLTWRGLL